jgi:hypothetical protein
MVPGRLPAQFGVTPQRGCPFDCGLCTEHEQHTCLGLVEVTSSCNLRCPMCYASSGPGGRHVLPEELERRLTFPDVVDRLVTQCGGLFAADDFLPLPCAHPNCHTVAYVYRNAPGGPLPLTRFIDGRNHPELLANGITFTRPQVRRLMEQYLGDQGCCGPGGCGEELAPTAGLSLGLLASGAEASPLTAAADFFRRALSENLGARNIFRVTITSFLDAYNFDVRRVMKCCTHHVLPSGHVIPFCAYNVLYREGHVPLPPLDRAATASAAVVQLGVK